MAPRKSPNENVPAPDAGVFSKLDAPEESSTGLTSEMRRRLFLNEEAVQQNVDMQKNITTFGCDLSLIEFPEWQRTKHVHRLHPYLGKFVPQLVELFLRRFFNPRDTVLDPFSGSATTLVEASTLGIHAIGTELSAFNCLIANVKTRRHDIGVLRREVLEALARFKEFSRTLKEDSDLPLFGNATPGAQLEAMPFSTTSDYLNAWFAPRTLQELLFYRSIIGGYSNRDVLRVILTRSARSARLISHYDLARPKQPLKAGESYYCAKHRRTCMPIGEAGKFLNRYSHDTIRRIGEFEKLRTSADVTVVEGDARTVPLPEGILLDGIFTSPPYVGMIDYHDQHRYAYELFPELDRRDDKEIGPMSLGQSKKAQRAYQADIAAVFRHFRPWLKPKAKLFVVANDRHDLYPGIAEQAGLRLVDTFHRPVPMRTERDTTTYFESIFWFELEQ